MDWLIVPLFTTVIVILDIYWWIIIASVIMSWLIAFNVVNPRQQFVYILRDFLYKATEPALKPIRRYMPDLGGIDLSPMVLLLAIFFLKQVLVNFIS